jgi:hypothetical protein
MIRLSLETVSSCASVAIAVAVLLASPILVRGDQSVTVSVSPSRVSTWDEMIRLEARNPKTDAKRARITPRMPGLSRREIGNSETDPISPASAAVTPYIVEKSSEESALGPTLITGFLALADDNTSIPPDTHGAAGPDHLMTMLNTQVRIQDKTGVAISTVSLDTFWGGSDNFDPKIVYDSIDSRWIATVDQHSFSPQSNVRFAISDTSDPTGSWTFLDIDADGDEGDLDWADFPGLGVNKNWIAITNNMFTVSAGSFTGAKMWVIDKATALAGGPITFTTFATGFDLLGGSTGFAIKPCVTYDATEPTLYCVDNSGITLGGVHALRVSQITGTGLAPVYSDVPGSTVVADSGFFLVANNFDTTQIPAAQPGAGAPAIDTNDPRISDSPKFRDGRIWVAHTAGLPINAVDRTGVFWYQLDPTTMSSPIVQSGVLDGGAGVHHYFPSITANANNDACIGFTRSSLSLFAQAVATGRSAGDPPGAMDAITLLKLGESTYSKFFGGADNRWGDYSATVIDPSDDLSFWTIQEFAGTNVGAGVNDGRWGTWWAKKGAPTPPDLLCVDFRPIENPVNAGVDLDIEYEIQNQGGAASDAFELEWYLSPDNVIESSDCFLVGDVLASLGAGASTGTLAQTVTLPPAGDACWAICEGEYYLGVIIDVTNAVAESDEDNNRNRGDGLDRAPVQVNATECVPCTDVTECDDQNTCTDDACTNGLCGHTNNTLSCDDENPCTENDLCSDGACSGEAISGCCQVDSDCLSGELCAENACIECTNFHRDDDDDGFGVDDDIQCLLAPADPYAAIGAGDCDDSDPTVNPDASEECGNSIDEDCDGQIDPREPQLFYADEDGDSHGDCEQASLMCDPDLQFPAIECGDCDDTNDAISPSVTESCNGLDNNCDGGVDEGFDVGEPCSIGAGECLSEGLLICTSDGDSTTCGAEPGIPSDEICDGLDNDCDGIADNNPIDAREECAVGVGDCRRTGATTCVEGNLLCNAVPGDPAIEACDGLDNDCDGIADNNLIDVGEGCDVGLGECLRTGAIECVDGGLVCSEPPGEPQAEVCDGLDNDCDGAVDEIFALGGPCSVGVGACSIDGWLVCDGNGGSACNVDPGAPSEELCDDVDNDCDGQIDEDNVCVVSAVIEEIDADMPACAPLSLPFLTMLVVSLAGFRRKARSAGKSEI